MSWFLYCIAKNPDEQVGTLTYSFLVNQLFIAPIFTGINVPNIQKLLFDEVDEIFEHSDRQCTPQDAANLKYLDCCIKETLRMYPSIPGVMRTITEDTEIGEVTLPK